MTEFNLPMDAGPADRVVGRNEFGAPVYETILGNRYAYGAAPVQPQRNVLDPVGLGVPMAPALQPAGGSYEAAQPSVGANVGNFGNALAGIGQWLLDGISAPGRAAQGQPVSLGDVWGTALDAGMIGAPVGIPGGAMGANGIRAYHGSPHDFDRFEWSPRTYGTGEGAQAYGHGLYFAESEDVARSYRDALSGTAGIRNSTSSTAAQGSTAQRLSDAFGSDGSVYSRNGRNIADYARKFSRSVDDGPDGERIYTFGDGSSWVDFGSYWDVTSSPVTPGRLYEVNIAADPADFLDWDKPLSEQPKAMALIDAKSPPAQRDGTANVSALFNMPVAKGEMERRARDAGIPGIKFLDAGSRGAGDGSRNYVVFDDKLITILRKYGIGAMVPGAGYLLSNEELRMAEVARELG